MNFKPLILSAVTLPLAALGAAAADFTAGGLHYHVLSSATHKVAVTAPAAGAPAYEGLIAVPERVTDKSTEYDVIAVADGAFASSTALRGVKLPVSVSSIGAGAFSGCDALEWVMLGSGLQSVGPEALSGCVNLTDVGCQAEVPPTVDAEAFDAFGLQSAALSVPEGNIAAYEAAPVWQGFSVIKPLVVTERTLVINLFDGASIEAKFSDKPELSFLNGHVTFSSATASQEIGMGDLTRFFFRASYGIDGVESLRNVVAEGPLFTINFNGTDISLAAGDELITVADTAGRVVARGKGSVSLQGKPAGVYVVSVAGKAVKLAKTSK